MRHRAAGDAGFTLLEVLAAITLLSLVLGTAAASLSSSSAFARFQEARSQVRELDLRGRLHARTHGTTILASERHDDGRRGLVLRSWPAGEWLGEACFEGAVRAELRVPPTGVRLSVVRGDRVLFDRHGRSPDYHIRLQGPDRELNWSVSGTTGWLSEEEQR